MMAADWPMCVEAEELPFIGTPQFMLDGAGYSGLGYVRMPSGNESALVWRVNLAEAGIYRLEARVATPFGTKGYELDINGLAVKGYFRGSGEFTQRSLGLIELTRGENVLRLAGGWGHYDVDNLQLAPAEAYSPPRPVPAPLSDPAATPAAQALFARLRATYGSGSISGMYRAFGQTSFSEAEHIHAVSGRYPVIHGADLMPFSPSFAEREPPPTALIDDLLAAGRAGHPILVMWHWTLPTPPELPYYKGFHVMPGHFDLAAALEPGSPGHAKLLKDIDAIAPLLARFQDAGLPVLWRPLHEADGAWFWWGGSGPATFQRLWRLMRERLTTHHGLHHLIWVYSSSDQADLAWYPGDDVVDIVAPDIYTASFRDPMCESWERLQAEFDGRKLLALGEVGGVPDIARMRRLGVGWSFFLSWPEAFGPASMDPADLREVYNASGMVTFDNWSSATPPK